jgi:hypothetical protein
LRYLKKGRFDMIQKKVLGMMALAVVLAIMMFTGISYAQVSWETGAQENLGNTVLFQYYDIRTTAQGGPGLSDNYFTVVNADDIEFTNAHVRVRTGQCSVELLDFDVILSPHDVFAFDLYQTATGSTQFASCDTDTLVASGFNVDSNGCYVLDSTTFPEMLGLIETCGNCPSGSGAPLSAAAALEATRWGYVEVIGEVELGPSDYPGSGCGSDADECSSARIKAGDYTAWSFIEDEDNDVGDCDCAYWNGVDDQLFGRVYYARFDAERNLVRLASANGLSLNYAVCGISDDIDNCTDVIIHRPCYSDTSAGCNVGDGELENTNDWLWYTGAKFAYNAPYKSSSPLPGATDLNYCFYKNTITTPGDVVNKVGAGATFGPTLADLYVPAAPRNGIAGTTANIICDLNDYIDKGGAVSHYFYIPGQGQTRYVFTFPLQHFINQSITITKIARFNNEEETCAIPTGKFISPGLPVAGLPRGEVTILQTQESGDPCTFNEGWLAFDLEVTSDAINCEDRPAALGMVVNYGDNDTADVMTTNPMQWSWGLDWMLNED